MNAPSPNPHIQQQATAKKTIWKRWWFWIIVIIVVAVIATNMNGGSKSSSNTQSSNTSQSQQQTDSNKQQDAKPAEKTIELQATATGNGSVMWMKNGSSNSEQFNGNWSKTFTGDEAKELNSISVSGDLTGGNDQKVTCKVIVNGEEKDAKEASGAAGNAFCSVPLF